MNYKENADLHMKGGKRRQTPPKTCTFEGVVSQETSPAAWMKF